MTIRIPQSIRTHAAGFRNSYTQVFFSDPPGFALILLLVSFMENAVVFLDMES